MATKIETPKKRAIAVGETAMSVALNPKEDVRLTDGFSVNVNGLTIQGKPPMPEWEDLLKSLRVFERGAQFDIGDAILYGEERFGEEAAQVLDPSLGWSVKTLGLYRWVAHRISRDRRRMDRLGIAHHILVAPLPALRQKHWLDKASADDESEPWTVARLRAAVKTGEDVIPTMFVAVVYCDNETKRDKLMDRLEKEGFEVKAAERRKPKKTNAA